MSAGPALAEPDTIDAGHVEPSTLPARSTRTRCPARSDGVHFVPHASGARVRRQRSALPERHSSARPIGPVGGPVRRRPLGQVPFAGESGASGLAQLLRAGLISTRSGRHWTADRSATAAPPAADPGLGTSTAVDTFEGELRWRPSPLWIVTLLAAHSTQTQLTAQRALQFAVTNEVTAVTCNRSSRAIRRPPVAPVAVPFEVSQGEEIDNAFNVTTTRVELRGERRISRRLTLDGTASW